MRILHVISGIDPENGGPTAALRTMAASQGRAGLKVTVAATYQRESGRANADTFRAAGVETEMIGPARGKLSRHRDLPQYLADAVRSADVVHVHAVWEEIQLQAARAARSAGVPYVWTPHGMLDPWNWQKNPTLKRLYFAVRLRRRFDAAHLVHCATAIEASYVARLGLKASTLVEPLALDFREYEHLPPPGRFTATCAALRGRRYVLFLGRIHAGKGLELLIPAMATLDPAIALVVAGPDGDFRPQADRLVREHRLGDRVIFTGMLGGDEKRACLVDAAVLALPSWHENFGLVVIEALACGTPVVVSDQVSLHPDIRASGVGGVVPLRTEPLVQTLHDWLIRSAEGTLRERARHFSRRYDADAIAAKWADHYAAAAGVIRSG